MNPDAAVQKESRNPVASAIYFMHVARLTFEALDREPVHDFSARLSAHDLQEHACHAGGELVMRSLIAHLG